MTFQRILLLVMTFSSLSACVRQNQTSESELKNEIEKIISTKKADVGVSILGPNGKDNININGNKLYPMLSVVKFPIALATLNKVGKGELAMTQNVYIKKEELLENTWSPFKREYPEGNLNITLEEAINWMVSESDNNMTDIILRFIGGTQVVEDYINNENVIIKNNEEDMHIDWESQFVNKATPNTVTELLKDFSEGKLLNKENTNWLYNSMVNSPTGGRRLKGKLPDVVIAQRAGTSFTNDDGITGAINNIGIMELPNKQKIYIAVFVHNTSEEFRTGEEIIADIAKVTWEYYSKKSVTR